jgi:hemolysin activation/secretion protein
MTPGFAKRRTRGRWTLAILAASLALSPLAALAQAIERNLPPAPNASAPVIAAPRALPADQDPTPIGPALTGIVVLGGSDAVVASPKAGVDVSRTPRLADDMPALQRFLGRPLSRKLIAQIEAEIAGHYRQAAFPFVNLTTPEQDITAGVLQVRALEFRLGSKSAPGARPRDAAYILSRVRVSAGQDIDAGQLAQDLDWLDRYPFRRSEAQFAPGSATGLTDLALQTTNSRPWSAYFGYADSGSPLTGTDRYFAGFQSALPGLQDAVVSYQYTGSGDAVFDDDQAFHSAIDPSYVSDAGRLIIPTLARQDVEASLNYVRTNQPVQAFLARNTVVEASVAYRSALSDFWAALPGEATIGVEAKRDDSRTLFDGESVKAAGIDVFQVTVGFADQVSDALGHTSGELTAHISPGGVGGLNTDAAFSAFSDGADARANYAYVAGDLTRATRLPPLLGAPGFTLVTALIGQYAAVRLPQTEQMGLGGVGLVRGYTLDDGAFDTALVWRNELRTPAFSVLNRTGRSADQASPYVFIDAGYGQVQGSRINEHMASAGIGTDYQFGRHLTVAVDGAWALETAGRTPANTVRLESRATFSF